MSFSCRPGPSWAPQDLRRRKGRGFPLSPLFSGCPPVLSLPHWVGNGTPSSPSCIEMGVNRGGEAAQLSLTTLDCQIFSVNRLLSIDAKDKTLGPKLLNASKKMSVDSLVVPRLNCLAPRDPQVGLAASKPGGPIQTFPGDVLATPTPGLGQDLLAWALLCWGLW